jgi:predicted oxidoreductase
MEKFVSSGKVRSLGVSNFTVEQLQHLGTVATVPISVNQVEVHPYLPQRDLVEYCKGAGISVMGCKCSIVSRGRTCAPLSFTFHTDVIWPLCRA